MDKGMAGAFLVREIGIIQDKSVLIQHLGDQYGCITSMYIIIAFYATAKQALILLLIWQDLGFIGSGQMRPSVRFFLIMACQSDSEHHTLQRGSIRRGGAGVNPAISP